MTTIPDNINNIGNLFLQSPYLYLQGAGSDKSDGSAEGVHLRWDFGEGIAEKHIPKGNLAAPGGNYYTTAGFSKADDFVKIYRTGYNRDFPIIVDLANTAPSQIIDLPSEIKIWRYNGIAPVPNLPANKCNVLIRFTNVTKYDAAKQLYNPSSDRSNFLKNYSEVVEVEVEGLLMFGAYVEMQVINDTEQDLAEIESISADNKPNGYEFISNRKTYISGSTFLLKEDTDLLLQENESCLEIDYSAASNGKVMADNIKYIRFRCKNCFPVTLYLETYRDFLLGKNEALNWQLMTNLSLSIDEDEVYDRLERANEINDKWTKYVNGAKVNVANYKTRWDDETEDCLLRGVISYLEKSQDADNLEANTYPGEFDPPEEEEEEEEEFDDEEEEGLEEEEEEKLEEEFEISYLELLKLAAFDFHVARMLGFGHIDADIPNTTNKYVYIAVYETTVAFDGVPAKIHSFMTLPIGKTDYKLPVVPDLYELKYGLNLNSETEIPIELTDEKGYSLYDDSRAVGLYVKPFELMREMGAFFVPEDEFTYEDNTEPILYGIAYRKNGKEWKKPEISNDPDFQDTGGVNETIAVIRPDPDETDSNLIYTHLETEKGKHDYAVYGINWFSRVSQLSDNILSTDYTDFPIRNRLIPPLNLGVQLIQEEESLIFTTEAEQERLAQLKIDSPDSTLVRLTFEWNNVHASNYWYGKEAEFFFRTEALNFIKGTIHSVINLGEGVYKVYTSDCDYHSTGETFFPKILEEEKALYVGSFLTVNEGGRYLVQSVERDNNGYAVFTVKEPEVRETIETEDNVQRFVNAPNNPPAVNKIFYVPENISLTEAWSVPLTQKIELKKLSEHPYTDSQGTEKNGHIGGVFAKATITDIENINDKGVKIPGSKTGAYWIAFNDDNVLEPHGDPKVEWYKGSVRIKVIKEINGKQEEEMRVLEVWDMPKKDIDGKSTSKLQLIAYDSTFDTGYVEEELEYEPKPELDPEPGYEPIPTGADIDVNYHPGYRVYFTHETGFDQSSILPAKREGSKQTLIACRSTDILDSGEKIVSPLSTPAVIFAREIVKPVAPESPKGALFATRPNFFGKASYTFDTKVNTDDDREPYALVFYRANEQSILDALYRHDTVLQIQEDLAEIEDDTDFNIRWEELVNVETVMDENAADFGLFKERNGYRFPNPDNENFVIPNPNPSAISVSFDGFDGSNPGSGEFIDGTEKIFGAKKTYKDIVKLAINNAFLPLTEQPVLYRYLEDECYQTSDRKPIIRDSNGQLIIPGSEDYDGAPMAVKFTATDGRKVVRFTDYTLDGASTSIYFYYAIEMSDTLAVSDRSKIWGPINLINTAPPKAPEIRKFYTQPENTVTGDTTTVLFEINDYPEGEGVSKILIYRALDPNDAMTIRTMQLAATIDVGEPVIDDFSDLDYYPFGDAIYYRLVAVRTVKTSKIAGTDEYETEDVPSYPTSLILTNIIDVNNPSAPELTYEADENGDILENVVLEWEPTAYNGTYYLYRMNNSGNWTELYHVDNKYSDMQYELPDNLPKTDEDGDNIYYRFKVMVENSSGLFSLEEKILII